MSQKTLHWIFYFIYIGAYGSYSYLISYNIKSILFALDYGTAIFIFMLLPFVMGIVIIYLQNIVGKELWEGPKDFWWTWAYILACGLGLYTFSLNVGDIQADDFNNNFALLAILMVYCSIIHQLIRMAFILILGSSARSKNSS